MRNFSGVTAVLTALLASPVGAKLIPGDAKRGAEVFRNQHCVLCHAIRGEGGSSAPDLGKVIGRRYTPSLMAATMWNHAPAMWEAMDKQGIKKPELTEPQAADLFAYFHSVRFFERPGDAGRGKQVFVSKRCAQCHGIRSAIPGGGPPVDQWGSLLAPIALARQMWNHAAQMQTTMAARKIQWPRLTAEEFTDLLVYLQNLPETRGRTGEFAMPARDDGESLFKEKGCAHCHQGKLAIETRPVTGTVTDFVVAMWNHAEKMWAYSRKTGQAPPQLDEGEMSQIVAYLWYIRLFAEPGNAEQGRRVFERKQCAACHEDPASGAPNLPSALGSRTDPLRPFSMVSILWRHGPAMLASMKAKNIAWPRFMRAEMADLTEHLNSSRFRDTKARD